MSHNFMVSDSDPATMPSSFNFVQPSPRLDSPPTHNGVRKIIALRLFVVVVSLNYSLSLLSMWNFLEGGRSAL